MASHIQPNQMNRADMLKLVTTPVLVSTLMLLWALYPSNPYGYYILLRWVCCAAFVFMAIVAARAVSPPLLWLFIVAALVYNPLIRIHLNREIWSVINVLSIILMVGGSIIVVRRSP